MTIETSYELPLGWEIRGGQALKGRGDYLGPDGLDPDDLFVYSAHRDGNRQPDISVAVTPLDRVRGAHNYTRIATQDLRDGLHTKTERLVTPPLMSEIEYAG